MGLGTILGGFGAAEQGAEAGIRQAKSDQMRDREDELRTQQLATEQNLLPDKAALARKQIASTSADLADKETLRPGAVKVAEAKQNLDHQEIVSKVAKGIMTDALTIDQGRDELLGRLGTKIETGDTSGAASLLNEMGKTPLFPRMKEFGSAVDMAVTQAPAGSKDIAGAPIQGKAVQVTFDNGTTQFLNPASWQRQVAQIQAAQDKASQVKLRPGDTLYNTRTGKASFTAPPPAGMEWVGENPDGSPIYRKLGASGTGAGAGSGKAGKPGKDEAVAAVDGMIKDVSEKISVEQKGQAYTLAQRALESGAVTDPIQAAQLGIDAALHPEKVVAKFNPETGAVDRVYQEPNLANGRRITVAPNAVKLDDYAKTVEPSVMKNLAEDQLNREASVAPEDQRAALRDQWIKVANTPDLREKFLQAATAKGGAQGRAVAQGKLDLIQKFGPRPGGAAAQPARSRFGGGGLGDDRYTGGDARVPPEVAKRAEAAQKEIDDRKAAEAESIRIKRADEERKKADSSWLTPAVIRGLTQEEAQDYLKKYRDVLDPRAMQALSNKATYGKS